MNHCVSVWDRDHDDGQSFYYVYVYDVFLYMICIMLGLELGLLWAILF